MKMVAKISIIVWLMLCPLTFADTCTPPRSSIDPSVVTSISFDKKTGLYTYQYTLQSSAASAIPLDFFILRTNQEPSAIRAPAHWLGDFVSTTYMPLHLSWMSARKGSDLIPGGHLSGFSFQSTQSPGLIQYYAEGRTRVPASSPVVAGDPDDEPEPNCPGWDFDNPRFATIVTGMATGPSNSNTISVAIRLREEKGDKPCNPIDPTHPLGKLSVLLLGSKTFDPSKVVISSLRFGPSEAAPLSSKLVSEGGESIASWDEHEEWEKIANSQDPSREKNLKHQNLLLIFDQASLGIQCILDKALFLTGKTQSGVSLIGGVSSRLVGCDVSHPGKRPKKK